MLLAQTSLLSVDVHLGFGKPAWDIPDFKSYLFYANITGVCSIIAAAWSKTSFAVLLLRFTEGWKRKFVWFVIITVNLFLGLSALFTYVQCSPIKRLWDGTVEGKCWDQHVIVKYNSFSSAWSGVMDIMLAVLPWSIINRRSLNQKERLGVLVAMSMGVFAGATSIAKTATLSAIANPDIQATVALMIMATAETSLTIIAASIPFLRVLIRNTIRDMSSAPRFYHYLSPSARPSPAVDAGHITLPSPARTRETKNIELNSQISSASSHGSSMNKPLPVPPGPPGNSWIVAPLEESNLGGLAPPEKGRMI
jgi:rhodopsin domain-containing protein